MSQTVTRNPAIACDLPYALVGLELHPLDNVATVRRLVEFYAREHNTVLPHSAFRGLTRQTRGSSVLVSEVTGTRAENSRMCGGQFGKLSRINQQLANA